MTSDFNELQSKLEKLWARVYNAQGIHNIISAPDFDPMDLRIKGLTGLETPDTMHGLFEREMVAIADYQRHLIKNSLEAMQSAVILIEAQQAYSHKQSTQDSALMECVEKDKDAFEYVMSQSISLSAHNKAEGQNNEETNPASYAQKLNNIVEEYAVAVKGEISIPVAAMNGQELLQKIYECRLDIAEAVMNSHEQAMHAVRGSINGAILIRKSIDEGIVSTSSFLYGQDKDLMANARLKISEVAASLDAIKKFLAETMEMDPGNDGLTPFTPGAYTPNSIIGIAHFTP